MITVIINPISGGAALAAARQRAELASAVLASKGEEGRGLRHRAKGHARELAARAAADGARLVIAWGGDGTMNEVASALVFGRDVRSRSCPPDPATASRASCACTAGRSVPSPKRWAPMPRAIDAGELGGRLFFNIAGIGFDAHVAACLDRDGRPPRICRLCADRRRESCGATESAAYRIDDEPTSRRALLVTLANSPQFGNGARIAPGRAARRRAARSGGVRGSVATSERLRGAAAVHRRTSRGCGGCRAGTIERVTIGSEAPMIFHVDGEPVQGGTRLEARVHPGALKVCVR